VKPPSTLMAACLLTACLLTRPAFGAPTPEDMARARAVYNEGLALRAEGDLPRALDKFREAYERGGTPITALEYGRTHALMGHLRVARDLLRSVARIPTKPDESPRTLDARSEAARLADETEARLATLTIRIVPAAATSSATVSVDGTALEPAAAPVQVDPGVHRLRAVVPDGRGNDVDVTLREGERREVEIALGDPLPPALPHESPQPEPSNRRTIAILVSSVGVVGLATGGVFGIRAMTKHRESEDACTTNPCSATSVSLNDEAKTAADTSTIALASGVAVLGLGAYLFFTSGGQPATSLRVTPVIGPTHVGIGAQASF
jgi:hypothetical protein